MNRFLLIVIALLSCAAAAAPLASEGGSASVSIANKKYDPATINIKVGDTVTWTNNDDHDHTVVADDGSFKSDKLGNGDIFQHQFKKAGTYSYSCAYHPRMKGKVIVAGK